MSAGTLIRPATPTTPLRTVRRERGDSSGERGAVGSAMVLLQFLRFPIRLSGRTLFRDLAHEPTRPIGLSVADRPCVNRFQQVLSDSCGSPLTCDGLCVNLNTNGGGRAGLGRRRLDPATDSDGEVTRASPATSGLHPRPRARGRRRAGVRSRPRAQRLGHDHPARPGAPGRPGPDREGPRRRHGAGRERPVRARLRREVVTPAAREGSDRRGGRSLRRAGYRDRAVGRDHDVRHRPPADRRAPADAGHELAAGRGRRSTRPAGPTTRSS